MPRAGGHYPDQAERAHRGPAQSRRHRQHHHAGRHSLRNELLNGPVDTAQEVQTHHQHLLRLSTSCSRSHQCLPFTQQHVYTNKKVYLHMYLGQNGARSRWEIIKERMVLPLFLHRCNAGLVDEHFCTFCLVPFFFYCFCLYISFDSWVTPWPEEVRVWGEFFSQEALCSLQRSMWCETKRAAFRIFLYECDIHSSSLALGNRFMICVKTKKRN